MERIAAGLKVTLDNRPPSDALDVAAARFFVDRRIDITTANNALALIEQPSFEAGSELSLLVENTANGTYTDDYNVARFVLARNQWVPGTDKTYAEQIAEDAADGIINTDYLGLAYPQLYIPENMGTDSSDAALLSFTQFYGIKSLDEAAQYLNHPLLGPAYLSNIQALVNSGGLSNYPKDILYPSTSLFKMVDVFKVNPVLNSYSKMNGISYALYDEKTVYRLMDLEEWPPASAFVPESIQTNEDVIESWQNYMMALNKNDFEQQEALHDYKGSTFVYIIEMLQKFEPGTPIEAIRNSVTESMNGGGDESLIELVDTIENIDNSFDGVETLQEFTTYRLEDENEAFFVSDPNDLVGTTIQPAGYLSTSASREGLQDYMNTENSQNWNLNHDYTVFLEIKNPPGVQAGVIGPVSGGTDLLDDDEHEILYARGTEFKVTGVEETMQGNRKVVIYQLTAVPVSGAV